MNKPRFKVTVPGLDGLIVSAITQHGAMGSQALLKHLPEAVTVGILAGALRRVVAAGGIQMKKVRGCNVYALPGPIAAKNPNVAPALAFRPPMPMSARTLASIATAAAARR